jgi:recombinational DNA repair ATPase RecF
VLAELDTGRRQDLLQRLSDAEQVLLTTTDLELFSPEFVGKSTLWHVKQGRLQEVRHED